MLTWFGDSSDTTESSKFGWDQCTILLLRFFILLASSEKRDSTSKRLASKLSFKSWRLLRNTMSPSVLSLLGRVGFQSVDFGMTPTIVGPFGVLEAIVSSPTAIFVYLAPIWDASEPRLLFGWSPSAPKFAFWSINMLECLKDGRKSVFSLRNTCGSTDRKVCPFLRPLFEFKRDRFSWRVSTLAPGDGVRRLVEGLNLLADGCNGFSSWSLTGVFRLESPAFLLGMAQEKLDLAGFKEYELLLLLFFDFGKNRLKSQSFNKRWSSDSLDILSVSSSCFIIKVGIVKQQKFEQTDRPLIPVDLRTILWFRETND